MKTKKKWDYEKVLMVDDQDRAHGFHKRIFDKKPELRRVVEMVKIKKGRILDIGCASGLITECLPYYYPKATIYGCDISKAVIAYDKKFGSKKVSYKLMKKKLPYPSNYFDACLCLDVLEHIPDVNYFLKELKRVLKNDGVFFGAIPCEGQPFTISWFFRKVGFWENLTFKHVGHIHPEFTHDYIVKLFEKKGFRILKKKFSERIPVQFLRYFLFMIPKEMLEVALGKKRAEQYYCYRDISQQKDIKDNKDIIVYLRTAWFKLNNAVKIIDDIDAEYFNNHGFTAWKMNLLVKNQK